MRTAFAPLAGMLVLGLATAVAQSPTAVRWAEGAPNTVSDTKNGNKVEGIKTDDIHIFASLGDIKETEYNRVWVQVANHGKTPLDFDPQGVVLLNGDKSLRAEVPEKAANQIQKFGEAKSQELASAKCNMMITGDVKTGGGGAGCAPTQAQMQMSKQVAAFEGQQAEWVRQNALKQKSIPSGEEEQGVIVFKKDKKSTDYILRVPIGGQVFEFPLHADNKSPSFS